MLNESCTRLSLILFRAPRVCGCERASERARVKNLSKWFHLLWVYVCVTLYIPICGCWEGNIHSHKSREWDRPETNTWGCVESRLRTFVNLKRMEKFWRKTIKVVILCHTIHTIDVTRSTQWDLFFYSKHFFSSDIIFVWRSSPTFSNTHAY